MSRRRQDNGWGAMFREARRVRSDPPIRELVKFIARDHAERDHKETLLERQRKRKLKECKERPKS